MLVITYVCNSSVAVSKGGVREGLEWRGWMGLWSYGTVLKGDRGG